jgi:hypothetical protein
MKKRFFYFLLINSIVAHYILYAPYLLTKEIFKGTIIAIFIALFLSCIKAYMLLYVFNYFKSFTLVEINKRLLGKFLGDAVTYLYIILYFIGAFVMFRGFVEVARQYMLQDTHIFIISAILVLVFFCSLYNTERTILNLIAFITLLITPLLIIQVLLSLKEVKWEFIQGTLIHSIALPKLITIASASLFFSGVFHLSLFNPLFSKFKLKSIILILVVVGVPAALTSIYIPIGIWGPFGAQNLQHIWISTADTMSVDLFIAERIFYIMLPLFFLLSMTATIVYGFVGFNLFKMILFSPKNDFILKVAICFIFVFVSSLIQNTRVVFMAAGLWILIWFGFQYTLAFILFFLAKLEVKKNI